MFILWESLHGLITAEICVQYREIIINQQAKEDSSVLAIKYYHVTEKLYHRHIESHIGVFIKLN